MKNDLSNKHTDAGRYSWPLPDGLKHNFMGLSIELMDNAITSQVQLDEALDLRCEVVDIVVGPLDLRPTSVK
jgi:hypothetical protein